MTQDNGEELLQLAVHQTRRQVKKLLARQFPAPPVPDKVRKLPRPRARQRDSAGTEAAAAEPLLNCVLPRPAGEAATQIAPGAKSTPSSESPLMELSSPPAPVLQALKHKGRSTPLSADAYKIEFTAEQPLHDKLRQAQELLRHRVPDGDLATVFEQALDVLLPKLRKERFAEVSRPREPSSESTSGKEAPKRSRNIPAVVKRQVARRDGYQCTYIDATGRRCPERGLVEFHHVQPYGKDGAHELANIRLLCRAHNAEAARHDYGEQVMVRWRDRGVDHAPGSTVPAGDSWPPPGTAAKEVAAVYRCNIDSG